MANTINSRVYRDKYRAKAIDVALRGALVTEKICSVDRSENMRIQNPYSTAPTVTVAAIAGTYAVADFTITDEALTVTDQVTHAEHIMDFQSMLSNFDLFANRTDEMGYQLANKIDRLAINNLCEDGTTAYTTPVGGFTTASNVNEIMSNLISKVSGYADAYKGLFLVIENTDLVGFLQAGATNGFSFADATLNNGFAGTWMGVDIYVVRASTFASETLGTFTYTNSGHRVFGVKGCATVALPGGVKFEEKMVTGKTGMEVAAYINFGFKLWAPKAALIVDITLA